MPFDSDAHFSLLLFRASISHRNLALATARLISASAQVLSVAGTRKRWPRWHWLWSEKNEIRFRLKQRRGRSSRKAKLCRSSHNSVTNAEQHEQSKQFRTNLGAMNGVAETRLIRWRTRSRQLQSLQKPIRDWGKKHTANTWQIANPARIPRLCLISWDGASHRWL